MHVCMYVYKQGMEIIARTHVIIHVKLKIIQTKALGKLATLDSCHVGLPLPQGLGKLAMLASCHVGLPPPQGLGKLAAAGLVQRLACRRPWVRQARHAGLVPRRLAAAHSNSNVQCLCSKHGFFKTPNNEKSQTSQIQNPKIQNQIMNIVFRQ